MSGFHWAPRRRRSYPHPWPCRVKEQAHIHYGSTCHTSLIHRPKHHPHHPLSKPNPIWNWTSPYLMDRTLSIGFSKSNNFSIINLFQKQRGSLRQPSIRKVLLYLGTSGCIGMVSSPPGLQCFRHWNRVLQLPTMTTHKELYSNCSNVALSTNISPVFNALRTISSG